jgi:uncharacterized protein
VSSAFRFIVPAIFLLLFFAVPSLVRVYTDWLWFGEVGYQSVFTTALGTRIVLGVVAFAAVFGWLAFHLRYALRSLRLAGPIIWTGQEGVQFELPGKAQLQRLALAAAAILALPAALYASNQWMTWLAFRHGVPFGVADPVIGYDAAFYVFTLPFVDAIRGGLMLLVVLAALGAGAVYALSGSLGLGPSGGLLLSRPAQRHLGLLAAGFFVLLAVGAWLEIPRTLTTPAGIVSGASYSDVHARFPMHRLLVGVSIIAAILAAMAAYGRLRLLVIAAALYLLVSFGGEGYAAAVQRFIVTPNEQGRETPYIEHTIEFTRRAFGLENVEERELSGDELLTRDDINRNVATLRNVRLWDHRPLLDTFAQLQEIRPYYDFVSVNNDRYYIDGEYRQVMLSARELNSSALPNRTWVNERLTFTHGYGITLGPVNQVTQEGLPVLFIKDLPPVSSVDLEVTEPSIYFGELSNDHVFVGTRAREFHYPRGEANEWTQYTGSGGVAMDSLFKRLMFALRFRSQQIIFSTDITNDSRVLFNRRIGERVNLIAPFLWYERDPYIVVADGRLTWIQDAYTWSTRYPYSQAAANGVNYMRNSVKITVDAYNGTTTFYVADPDDPIVATYQRMFPTLFRPLGEMPAGLRRHVRYPQTLFTMQTAMYTTFHMENPEVFYNKEDQWEVPVIESSDGKAEPMEPYYTIMRLPGQEEAEFIQMVPLTPRRKDNLAAWLVARSDGEQYGHLLVFRFPKQKVIFGPRQVVGRINQDQVIAPQITLWNQQGSQVIQGTLLVIPIEESLLYIRPLYLRAQGGRIPELKRVIVAHQNAIVMEETLEEGLDRLFGQGASAGLRGGGPAAAVTPVVALEPAKPDDAGLVAMPQAPAPPAAGMEPAGDRGARALRACGAGAA